MRVLGLIVRWVPPAAALAVLLVVNYWHARVAFEAAGFEPWTATLAAALPDIVIAVAATELAGGGKGWDRVLGVGLLGLGLALSGTINAWVAQGTPDSWGMVTPLWVAPTALVAALAPLLERQVRRARSRPDEAGTDRDGGVQRDLPVEVPLADELEREPWEEVNATYPAAGEWGTGPETITLGAKWAVAYAVHHGKPATDTTVGHRMGIARSLQPRAVVKRVEKARPAPEPARLHAVG